jgi:signal transduction histidine kinase
MSKPFASLRAQLVVLIVAALVVAQAVSLWLFVDERTLAIRAALGFEAAGRAANVARLLEEAPPDLHASILRAANSPLVRFETGAAPGVRHLDHSDAGRIERHVRTLLGDSNGREIRVELHQIKGRILPLPHLSPQMAELHSAMMKGELSAVEMNLSIALAGGKWLNVGTRFERPPLQWPFFSTVTFGLTAALILVSVCWFLVTRITGPLRRLSRAADRLGRGEDVDALPVVGPVEVQDLTTAFNRMQDRLTRFVADRTRLLAAVGHDLRSPLTALRVRAEMVDDPETRESLIESVEEMQMMAEATLTFAQGLTGSEEPETVEIGAFLAALGEDMVETFDLKGGAPIKARVRPVSLRRAIRNVVENAVRYGGGAEVSWRSDNDDLIIDVADQGPGIAADKLEQVFDPFFRLEDSRSLETGGHGLGLSIARSIVRAHGGDIHLANRPEGGLTVSITVPLDGDVAAGKQWIEKEKDNEHDNETDTTGDACTTGGTDRRRRGSGGRLAREV